MIIICLIIIVFGILFTAQSQSLVGPESSFMYRNPEWAVNGSIITVIGVAILVGGITLSIRRKRLSSS
ncbi:MAG: hypothetical protein EX285_01380 [Thaumarchaeota archaeon]|nr:hypothetical protein [Nitrososphaerota archaeon]